jgi:hypothetical protein
MGNPPKTFATRANSGAALERIIPAGARIYEILHHPEAFTVQTIAAAGHIKGRHHAKVVMVKSRGHHLMTVLPADHRADLQKLEKIAGEPASLETEEEFESLFPKLHEGSDAAISQPLRFADLRGQKIDPGRLHRFRSGHSHRHHQAQRSWLRADREAAHRRPGDQGAFHPAILILQVKRLGCNAGVDCRYTEHG